MSRGTEFLTEVTEKLRMRITQLDERLLDEQKDIEGMHEYYWENYTEMDQYGYEDFDNRQALLSSVNARNEDQKRKSKLRKMLDSPFFGSVEFVYDGEDTPELFYIGLGNFAQEKGGTPLIYDWRAPVSGLFYDYDKGPGSYEAPCGRLDGEIVSKRQYKIRSGRMIYEFESDVKIDDDILKLELGNNGETKLKNIVSTIQKEQNAIIRNTGDRILVIQGAAGSGKTSIALHRIAYLLYHDRKRLNASNMLILSPNGVFSDYISHILPELGEEHIREMSFDLFAYRQLREDVQDCEDRYHEIERRMQRAPGHWQDETAWKKEQSRCEWKQSREYVRAVEGYLLDLEDRLPEFRDISFHGYVKTAEELMKLFYDKFPDIPLLSRMDAVMEYCVDEYETLKNKTLSEEELQILRERFQSMYLTTDSYRIYNWFLEDHGLQVLPDVPKENRYLGYEDVYPLLYLKKRLLADQNRKRVRHLVIDEMQDYTYLQYELLHRMFDCDMTILGDRAQTVGERTRDVTEFLPQIFGKNIRRIEMKRSYRNTLEIAEYARSVNHISGIEYLERHGKPVQIHRCSSVSEAMQSIMERALGERGRYETAAVLTMTDEEARLCYYEAERAADRNGLEVSYIDRDSSEFRKGLTVTTYYQAKGLEFDRVSIVGGDPENPFFPQFRYIAATRALHELEVFELIGE